MPVLPTLKIREIFWSFQGEGLRVGVPSIFIRLAGCAMGCDFCDTQYAQNGGESVTLKDMFKKVDSLIKRFPASQVVLTGGEPLEQDLGVLVSQLKDRKIFISIETNGIHFQNLPIDWWTVSPKSASAYEVHEGVAKKTNEVKLVVTELLTPDIVKKFTSMDERIPVFLQPQSGDPLRFKKTFELFNCCQQMGLKQVRVGYQVHRMFGAP